MSTIPQSNAQVSVHPSIVIFLDSYCRRNLSVAEILDVVDLLSRLSPEIIQRAIPMRLQDAWFNNDRLTHVGHVVDKFYGLEGTLDDIRAKYRTMN